MSYNIKHLEQKFSGLYQDLATIQETALAIPRSSKRVTVRDNKTGLLLETDYYHINFGINVPAQKSLGTDGGNLNLCFFPGGKIVCKLEYPNTNNLPFDKDGLNSLLEDGEIDDIEALPIVSVLLRISPRQKVNGTEILSYKSSIWPDTVTPCPAKCNLRRYKNRVNVSKIRSTGSYSLENIYNQLDITTKHLSMPIELMSGKIKGSNIRQAVINNGAKKIEPPLYTEAGLPKLTAGIFTLYGELTSSQVSRLFKKDR